MGSTFILMLREGLEAALIVGIVLAYLASIGRRDKVPSVLFGIAIAVGISVLAGGVLFLSAGGFKGRAEQVFDGTASVLAVGFLTWMIFWMRRHAMDVKKTLQHRVDEAISSPGRFGLATVAFAIVLREGIETALFLFATVRQVGAGPGAFGGALGLGAAVALGIAIYRGGVKVNLRIFFTLTGGILLIVAAGLAAHGVHELIEARVFPAGIEQIWRTGHILADNRGFGGILGKLVGYNAAPALTEVMVWIGYLIIAAYFFFAPVMKVRRTGLPA